MTQAEVAGWITAVATAIYTGCTIGLWLYTIKTVKALKEQINTQTNIAQSQAFHSTINAHRDLYMAICSRVEFLELASSGKADSFRERMLASMLINHCARIFNDYKCGIFGQTDLTSFIDDAGDLFELEIVRNRWPKVENMHTTEFKDFVNLKILSRFEKASFTKNETGPPISVLPNDQKR